MSDAPNNRIGFGIRPLRPTFQLFGFCRTSCRNWKKKESSERSGNKQSKQYFDEITTSSTKIIKT